MRSSFALIATAGVIALTLSGCTSAPAAPEAQPGASSNAVVVKGDFGDTPRVEFPSPLEPPATQCTEIIEGDGDRLVAGQQTLVGLAVYNGATGEKLQVTGFGGKTGDPVPLAIADNTLPGLAKGLSCGSAGSRVAVVVPADDAFGADGNPSIGIEPGDSLVFVIDVQRAFLPRANGAVRLSRDGFPAVVLAPDGRPGITVPKADPFENTEVEVLKEGSGQVVESGDTVVVHYTGVKWADGKVFDSTWETGAPAMMTVSGGDDSQVIPGFSEAVIGQKVGSQVAVVIPPGDGYGDQPQGDIPANSTLFFVIDILGVI
ncbi:FKBP-type peptidyl-prolyl cis-trans isomerase [Agromyces sp. NPDC055520]